LVIDDDTHDMILEDIYRHSLGHGVWPAFWNLGTKRKIDEVVSGLRYLPFSEPAKGWTIPALGMIAEIR